MKNRFKYLLLAVLFVVLLMCPSKAQAWCWDRPGFWYLDAKVELVPTDVWVTVPTGYWGGWYWYKWDCCTWRPHFGPAWAPLCQCNRPYCPLYCPPYCARNIVKLYP